MKKLVLHNWNDRRASELIEKVSGVITKTEQEVNTLKNKTSEAKNLFSKSITYSFSPEDYDV